MNKQNTKNYLTLACVVIFSMMLGSVITILIKGDASKDVLTAQPVVRKNSKKANFDPIYETYEAIMKEYYKEVDSDKLIDGAISGMLESLDDKHTMYFDKKAKEDFDTELTGSYYGIGAQIQLTEEKRVKIVRIFNDTPAEKSGLKVGDIFVKIDGESTEGMDATAVANKLRSSKVKEADIIIERDGEEMEFKVTKENVTLYSVSSEMLDGNIGYIGVSIFGQNTYSQFKEALEKLEKDGSKSLIIDIRGNSGGYLATVAKMLELFLDEDKVLFQMQTNEGTVTYKSSSKEKRDYPIVVLVDENSASASEIMTAAMKEEYGSAIVGKKTYGKGTVQITKDLSNGTMIKYTIEKWLTPSGKNIDGEGIEPDHEVDLSEDYMNDPSDENDSQLQKAIDLLK